MRCMKITMIMSVALACALGTLAASAEPETKPKESNPPPADEAAANNEGVEYLFVQTAHAITSKGNSLTLHGVGPTTLFFSDRPERITGHGTTEEFLQIWAKGKDSFAVKPPNATLSILAGDGVDVEDVVVVLRDPKRVGGQLTYTVKVLNGELPASGGASALFIDTIGMPLTPVSYAGARRRAVRRAVVRH